MHSPAVPIPTVWDASMGPKKTWQPFDYHTTRHDTDELTIENSAPLRHSSNPTSPSRHCLAPERRAFSLVYAGKDDLEQRGNAADLQERHEDQDSINRSLLSEFQIELSRSPLNLDPNSWPGLGRIVDGATNPHKPSNLLVLDTSGPKPQVILPADSPRSLTPSPIVRGGEAIRSVSTEQSHSGLQDDKSSKNQHTQPFGLYLSRGRSFSPPNPLDLRPTHATTSEFQIGSVTADFLPAKPLVNLPSIGQSSIEANLGLDSYDSSRKLTGEVGNTCGNVMASLPYRVSSGDSRRPSRLENRPPMSTVLCRNGPQCRKFVEGMHFTAAKVEPQC